MQQRRHLVHRGTCVSGASPWGGRDEPLDLAEPVRPPSTLLFASVVVIAVAIGLWLPHYVTTHIIGYVLSSFIAIGFLGAFQREDARRRQTPLYVSQPALNTIAIVAAVATVATAMAHVWQIANHYS